MSEQKNWNAVSWEYKTSKCARKKVETQENTHSYRQTKTEWFNKSNIYILRIKVFGILIKSFLILCNSFSTKHFNCWTFNPDIRRQLETQSHENATQIRKKSLQETVQCFIFNEFYLQSHIHFQSCWLPSNPCSIQVV